MWIIDAFMMILTGAFEWMKNAIFNSVYLKPLVHSRKNICCACTTCQALGAPWRHRRSLPWLVDCLFNKWESIQQVKKYVHNFQVMTIFIKANEGRVRG